MVCIKTGRTVWRSASLNIFTFHDLQKPGGDYHVKKIVEHLLLVSTGNENMLFA
jgi:hypothetical protein